MDKTLDGKVRDEALLDSNLNRMEDIKVDEANASGRIRRCKK